MDLTSVLLRREWILLWILPLVHPTIGVYMDLEVSDQEVSKAKDCVRLVMMEDSDMLQMWRVSSPFLLDIRTSVL